MLEEFLDNKFYIEITEEEMDLTPELDKIFQNYKVDPVYFSMCAKIRDEIHLYKKIGIRHTKGNNSWGWSIKMYRNEDVVSVKMFLDNVRPAINNIEENDIEMIFG